MPITVTSLFMTIFPFKYMQHRLHELAIHLKTWDAVACYLVCLSVHLHIRAAPMSAVNNAVSVEQNSHRCNLAALSMHQSLPLPPFLVDTIFHRLLKKRCWKSQMMNLISLQPGATLAGPRPVVAVGVSGSARLVESMPGEKELESSTSPAAMPFLASEEKNLGQIASFCLH